MKYSARCEFEARFPLRDEATRTIEGPRSATIVVDRDATLTGMMRGAIRIAPNTHVILRGMIAGNVLIETNAVCRIEGMVNGSVRVDGALLVTGTCRDVDGSDEAIFASSGLVKGG